jgi:hypothetical protein
VSRIASAGLLVLGLLQMAGELFHLPLVKGFALATAASPAPKVFSAVRGLETYSTHFYVEWTDVQGSFHSAQITPEMNSRVRGPYNRRNIFGAVLAYGPILVSDTRSRPMFDEVASYALCGEAPLLRELGVDPTAVSGSVKIRLEVRPNSHLEDLPLALEAPCR